MSTSEARAARQAARAEEDKRQLKQVGGVAMLGGGGYAISEAKPMVTGRTRLYHGTTPEIAKSIRQHGLMPSAKVDAPAITDILASDIKAKAKDLAYLTPVRSEAGEYAGQAKFLQRHRGKNVLAPELAQERFLAMREGMLKSPFSEGIVRADVPMWKSEIADKVRKNPEARGSFEDFRESFGLIGLLADQRTLRKTHRSLDRAVALEGGLSPKYIRGSDKFEKLTLREIGEYAKAHPGRFAGGVGLGVLGAAGVGLGVKTMLSARKPKADPTQKIANYKLQGERDFRGLDIAIENKKGSSRKWHDPHSGESGTTYMHYDYGYIRLTEGTDGDHVDVYVGPNEKAEKAFIVNQMRKPDFKEFDEQKVMLGFDSAAEAKAAYLKQYNNPKFFGSMKEMDFEEFKTKVLDKKNRGKKVAALLHLPGGGVFGGVGTVASQQKVANDDRVHRIAERLDDVGIATLASPYIADLAGAGLKRLMLRGGRVGALAAEGHGIAEAVSRKLHNPAVELGGLALVAPGVVNPIAKRIDKMFPGKAAPTQTPMQPQVQPDIMKTAEEVGRALANADHRVKHSGLGRLALGLGAVGTAGAALYGGKKAIDSAKHLTTHRHEPASYVGVPAGMRPPSVAGA